MKILFGLVENTTNAKFIAQNLFHALTRGKVKEANDWRTKLTLQINSTAVYLGEDEWFDILKELRKRDERFQADYILQEEQIKFLHEHKSIFPNALSAMIEKALNQNCSILELPIAEGQI